MNRQRTMKKGLMVQDLADLKQKGKNKFDYPPEQEVIVVLDEDGTEVEDDDYLLCLPDQTTLVLLFSGDRWNDCNQDEVDTMQNPSTRVANILLRLENSPGSIALLSELDLELLADIDTDHSQFQRFDVKFLNDIKQAADIHIIEKSKIRDTLDLLQIYHNATKQTTDIREKQNNTEGEPNPTKRRRKR